MDFTEDERLIQLFEQRQANLLQEKTLRDEVEGLKQKVVDLEQQRVKDFQYITEQSNLIRRYRALLKTFMKPNSLGDSLASPVPARPPVPASSVFLTKGSDFPLDLSETDSPEVDVSRTKRKAAAMPRHMKKIRIEQDKSSSSAASDEPVSSSSNVSREDEEKEKCFSETPMARPLTRAQLRKSRRGLGALGLGERTKRRSKSPVSQRVPRPGGRGREVVARAMRALKQKRINQIIDQSKIKYPTSYDDYRETHIGQVIWDTIVRCFRKSEGAMVTDSMIIEEGGKNLLTDKDKPFLDKKMLHRYFSYPFTFEGTEDEQTMVVRPVTNADEKTWVVFMPEWLRQQLEDDALLGL